MGPKLPTINGKYFGVGFQAGEGRSSRAGVLYNQSSRLEELWRHGSTKCFRRSVYSLSDVGTEHEERMATTLRLKDDYIAFDVLSITDPRLSFALRGTTDVTPDQSNPLSR